MAFILISKFWILFIRSFRTWFQHATTGYKFLLLSVICIIFFRFFFIDQLSIVNLIPTSSCNQLIWYWNWFIHSYHLVSPQNETEKNLNAKCRLLFTTVCVISIHSILLCRKIANYYWTRDELNLIVYILSHIWLTAELLIYLFTFRAYNFDCATKTRS